MNTEKMLIISALFSIAIGFCCAAYSLNNAQVKMLSEYYRLVGNTAENLAAIKNECEKDLPRNQECVLVYDYVPVNKE